MLEMVKMSPVSRFPTIRGHFDVGDGLKIRSRNGDDIYDEIIEFSLALCSSRGEHHKPNHEATRATKYAIKSISQQKNLPILYNLNSFLWNVKVPNNEKVTRTILLNIS